MRNTISIIAVAALCILAFSGCRCSHTWDAATCEVPKTCQFCGVTEGAPLGHTWSQATCQEPMSCKICHKTEGKALSHQWISATCTTAKTCAVCHITDGEPLAHVWQDASCETPRHCLICSATDGTAIGHAWIDATCDSPKVCRLCALTEGSPLGHSWAAATAETPKTCSICGKTDGSPLTADPRFSITACKPLFGRWEARRSRTAENIGTTDQDFAYVELTVYCFRPDGTMSVSTEAENSDACKQAMSDTIAEELYSKYDCKEDADRKVLAAIGMTVDEYAATYARIYFSRIENTTNGVYYVQDDCLFVSDTWDSEMSHYRILLTDSLLTLIDGDAEPAELVRQ